jgi:sestrin
MKINVRCYTVLLCVLCRMGNNKHVDTTSFRRAVWYYVQCLFGIQHDDYNYGHISLLLESHLKSYIKLVTCYPEVVMSDDYESFMKGFKHSEKVSLRSELQND